MEKYNVALILFSVIRNNTNKRASFICLSQANLLYIQNSNFTRNFNKYGIIISRSSFFSTIGNLYEYNDGSISSLFYIEKNDIDLAEFFSINPSLANLFGTNIGEIVLRDSTFRDNRITPEDGDDLVFLNKLFPKSAIFFSFTSSLLIINCIFQRNPAYRKEFIFFSILLKILYND